MFKVSSLSVQWKVKASASYFARSLNHEKLFAFAGFSPLHLAAGIGFVEIVKLLLDRGADVEKANADGKTFPRLLLCSQI